MGFKVENGRQIPDGGGLTTNQNDPIDNATHRNHAPTQAVFDEAKRHAQAAMIASGQWQEWQRYPGQPLPVSSAERNGRVNNTHDPLGELVQKVSAPHPEHSDRMQKGHDPIGDLLTKIEMTDVKAHGAPNVPKAQGHMSTPKGHGL